MIYNNISEKLSFFSLSHLKDEVKVKKEVQKMENKKTSYETLFIIDSTIGEEAIKGLVAKFNDLIAANGEIEALNEWGNKRLAYKIRVGSRELTEGYYVLVNYNADPSFPAELDRIFNITDGIIRSLTIKCEK